MSYSNFALSDGGGFAPFSSRRLTDGEESGDAVLAWVFVVIAAASTWFGACVAFMKLKSEHERLFIASSVAAAAGVMLYLCLAELFGKSIEAFEAAGYNGEDGAEATRLATFAFFGGFVFFYLLSAAAHMLKPPDEPSKVPPATPGAIAPQACVAAEVSPRGVVVEEQDCVEAKRTKGLNGESKSRALQMGLKAALAIGLHNLPEGLAGWMSTYAHGRSGMNICFGIILHNIPEGLCVALPIYTATQSRFKALAWASVAGAAEIVGGLIAATLIQGTSNGEPQLLYGTMFGLVNGMMTAVVVLEFIPHAVEMEPASKVWPMCFLLGMVVIALTLVTESL